MPGRSSLAARPSRRVLVRRLRRRPAGLGVVSAITLIGLAACGFGPVQIQPYDPEPGTESVCRSLVENLPSTLDDAVRRDHEPAISTAATWGSPPIVLRCGVPLPAEYRSDAQLFEVNEVAWLAVEGEGGYFFTTVDRVAHVEVAVPDDYTPEAAALADLAAAITEAVPLTADRPAAAAQ